MINYDEENINFYEDELFIFADEIETYDGEDYISYLVGNSGMYLNVNHKQCFVLPSDHIGSDSYIEAEYRDLHRDWYFLLKKTWNSLSIRLELVSIAIYDNITIAD